MTSSYIYLNSPNGRGRVKTKNIVKEGELRDIDCDRGQQNSKNC